MITDFNVGADVIEFGNAVFADFTTVQAAMTQVGSDVLITSGADTITIKNATTGSLTSSNFDFV